MIYRLYSAERQAGSPLGETNMPSNFAALEWAQSWLREQSGSERYSIASEDGSFGATFVRTAGGQWYAIGQGPG